MQLFHGNFIIVSQRFILNTFLMKPKVTFERISLNFVRGLDVHGLIVPRGVEPHQLCHRDRHPHRVRLLRLHDVRH